MLVPLTIGITGIGVEPPKGPNRGLRTMTRGCIKEGLGCRRGERTFGEWFFLYKLEKRELLEA